mmetsp:Transcript_52677/g.94022  ORF Transcript_52677/g.94022 Transcript_52677/m.94022 type:complete len:215 (-) Transcript_52677:743-1387(-)
MRCRGSSSSRWCTRLAQGPTSLWSRCPAQRLAWQCARTPTSATFWAARCTHAPATSAVRARTCSLRPASLACSSSRQPLTRPMRRTWPSACCPWGWWWGWRSSPHAAGASGASARDVRGTGAPTPAQRAHQICGFECVRASVGQAIDTHLRASHPHPYPDLWPRDPPPLTYRWCCKGNCQGVRVGKQGPSTATETLSLCTNTKSDPPSPHINGR